MKTPSPPPALIETMRLKDGRIALWPIHRARLLASAAALGYPLEARELEARLSAQIRAAALPARAWRIRLLLARDGGLSLETAPLPDTRTPVRLALAARVLDGSPCLNEDDPWLRHKTTHRPWFADAAAWLERHQEYFDVVFGNAAGLACEGSRSNVYVRDPAGRWLTPPVRHGLLPGVQRQWLLDAGLAREAALSLADLAAAPALRVSNALRGWLDARLDDGGRASG
jgi:branched-subunit amino acid aminotransferase/4-amino-4-deoxychorismate lyase